MKKEAINFSKSIGASFNKKLKKKKINVKNMKRNQTFSNLSNKSPCETMNTSKNQFSSQKKRFHVSTGKKLTYSRKMNESLKTDTSGGRLKSENKLGTKSANASQFLHPNRGYTNMSKKKKTTRSETKKTAEVVTHFNDISEIQEFNMTDEEESLINSSILKNIEDHDSLRPSRGNKTSVRKTKRISKKNIQSTKKKAKKLGKKAKLKFISSSKKSSKKSKKCPDKEQTDKSIKKRKVIFHSSKLKEVSPVENVSRGEEYIAEAIHHENDYRNIDSPETRTDKIKKVEFSQPSVVNEGDSEEIVYLRDSQGRKSSTRLCYRE